MSYIRYRGLYSSKSNFSGSGKYDDIVASKYIKTPLINSSNITTNTITSNLSNINNIRGNNYIKNDNLKFSFNGEDVSEHAEYLKKRTVLIETTEDELGKDGYNLQYKVGSGVLIHENELYPEGTSDKTYILTAAHIVVGFLTLKSNDEITDLSDIRVANKLKVMYFTKNNEKRISFIRVVGYCLSNDLALCEFVNYEELNTTDNTTWYTNENKNSILSAKLFKLDLNNLDKSIFKEGAKLVACGHTYVDDPFSITCGYIRSGSHMTEDYEYEPKDARGITYSTATPPFSPYMLSTLNLGPGNSGCGVFLQNHSLELVGIHSTSIKEKNEDTASMNAAVPPYILNSGILKKMIIQYNNEEPKNTPQRIVTSFINLDIYSSTHIMDMSLNEETDNYNTLRNATLLDDINTNYVFGRLTITKNRHKKYTYNYDSNEYEQQDEAEIVKNRNLITKVDILDNSANIVRTFKIGDEYPAVPLHALRTLVEPESYIRIYYYYDLKNYNGERKELRNEIIKIPSIDNDDEAGVVFDKPPYHRVFYNKQ